MLSVPGGAVGQGWTAMYLGGVTPAVPGERGGDGCSASTPADVAPDGPSEMLSSPGTLQTAKITRSAACNSGLAPDQKREVGGVLFYRSPDFLGAARCLQSLSVCFNRRLSIKKGQK